MPKLNPAQGPKAVKDRAILYDKITVNGIPIPNDKMILRYGTLKDILGWEDEDEYRVRIAGANGDPDTVAGFGASYLLVDDNKKKVRCHNNLNNRPFDEGTARKYAQDILNKKWAGPAAFPDETVNGETIIVGRTGQVESGQHRCVAGMLAIQMWRANPAAYPKWKEEPYLESLVVFGVSENTVIVRTLDNVRPRTLADTIYTSPVFANLKDEAERKECSKMLDAAIDLLWKRTGAGEDPKHKYQTHSSSFEFLDRHSKLKAAVKHVFEENTDRPFGLLKVPAGSLAAALYLMATAKSDVDEYLRDRKESRLDFSLQDKAEEFIAVLANSEDKDLEPLRDALRDLIDTDEGLGGRMSEKLAVIAAAWGKLDDKGKPTDGFVAGEPVKAKDLKLAYVTNEEGVVVDIADPPTFGGIDMGPQNTGAEPKEGDKDAEAEQKAKDKRAAKEKAAAEKLAKKAAKDAAKAGGAVDPVKDQVEGIRTNNKGRTLLFVRDADVSLFGVDAEAVGKLLKTKITKRPGADYPQLNLKLADRATFEPVLRAAQLKLAEVTFDDKGGVNVKDLPAPAAAAPTTANGTAVPKAAPKAVPPKAPAKPAGPPALRGGIGN